MGRAVNQPKKYIVSCRINGNEMETLNKIAQEAGTNISDLLRQSKHIRMSDEDIRLANNPDTVYLIYSVADDAVRGFSIAREKTVSAVPVLIPD